MNRFLIHNVVVIAMCALPVLAGGDVETYGDGVTLTETIAINTQLASPDDHVGKVVRVGGVIVFPYSAMGREAAAEGVFEAIKLTPEQIEAPTKAEQNHAEGETCDKTGPKAEGAGAGFGEID